MLSVGLIVDSDGIDAVTRDLIQELEEANFVNKVCLIVQDSGRQRSTLVRLVQLVSKRGLLYVARRIGIEVIRRFEISLLAGLGQETQLDEWHALEEFHSEKIVVKPVVSHSGFVFRYSEEDLAAIEACRLDVLVRAGRGILAGQVLSVCSNGILSFHHGDNRLIRGGTYGFWEVLFRYEQTGFIVQQLSEDLDGGKVVLRGSIPTAPSFALNAARILKKSVPFMVLALERLDREGEFKHLEEAVPYSGRLYRVPSIRQQAQYLFATAGVVLGKLFRKAFRRGSVWQVFYLRTQNWRSAALYKAQFVRNPPGRYLADPFPCSWDGNDVIFVEDFDELTQRGKISALEITEFGHNLIPGVLTEPHHLSFPFVFRDGEDLFLLPEAHESKEIRLYKCIDFPRKWEVAATLMTDVAAVDSMIVFRGGLYWLFTNIDTSSRNDFNSELHLFSSTELQTANWNPHPDNPVVFDSLGGRNGGLFEDNGHLYRVGQEQGFSIYGKVMSIRLVEQLSMDGYQEREVARVSPDFIENGQGTHTFSFAASILCGDIYRPSRLARAKT